MNAKSDNLMPDNVSRRKFLGLAGGLAGAGLLIGSCKKEDEPIISEGDATDLGTNDQGLLNMMFVMVQVLADLYEKVHLNPYNNPQGRDLEYIRRMRTHKITQREYLRNFLDDNGTDIVTDFSAEVDFTQRNSVLENAEFLENLTVGTFNEVARLFTSDVHVVIVGKITSVTARHASTISNMRTEGSFFGPVDVIGTEPGIIPSNAIPSINRFLATKVSGNNLPNK